MTLDDLTDQFEKSFVDMATSITSTVAACSPGREVTTEMSVMSETDDGVTTFSVLLDGKVEASIRIWMNLE